MKLLKIKNLFQRFRGKKTEKIDLSKLSTLKGEDDSLVPTLSYFDLVGLNGLEIPPNIRDRGYQNEGTSGDYPFRTFILDFGPTTLSTGTLDALYRAGAVNVTHYLTKLTKSQAVRLYKQAATDEGSRLLNMIKSGNDIEAREAQKSLDAANRLLEEISDGFNDGFLSTCLVTIFARDEKVLDQLGMIMQDNLIGNDHHLRIAYNRQKSGWISTLPIGNNRFTDKNDRRFMDRTAIVAASPFYSSEIPYSGGVPAGVNQHTGTMEFLNVCAKYLPNYSSLIVGASGSGKSFFNKFVSSSQIQLGYRIFSIDPDGENGPICRLLGGREVEVRENADVCLNVCAITEEEVEITLPTGRKVNRVVVPVGPKTGQLVKFYDKIMEGLTPEEKAIVKVAIKNTFNQFGITEDPKSLYEPDKTPQNINGEITYIHVRKREITLSDIYWQMLLATTINPDKNTFAYEQLKDPLADRLLRVCRGYLRDFPDGKLLDGQTSFGDGHSVDSLLDNISWINFNIKAIEGSDIYDIVMHILFVLGWEYFVKRPSLRKYHKRIKLEEGWRMKRVPGGMEFVEDSSRRSRKYNAGIDVITQDLNPFIDDDNGKALVKNATSAAFFRIGQIEMDERLQLKSIFNLSDGELNIICQRPPEDENDDSRGMCILRVGGSTAYIKVTVSEEMRHFIDTDPDWLYQHGLLPEVEEAV
ncbi:VirB4 family type IV secretion system protein [Cohnella phaseoli]|uniref:TraG P-loop domain-containing protein n=1 Tax=Cohnella phaseoli TaxID=456490 RepID=A0A3D9JPW5_9BACL|nr:hypothetical protein [Cohnella phaseoli]RED76025.1 hypothetical protein DFP98_11385 [Cohnella phaseoli]